MVIAPVATGPIINAPAIASSSRASRESDPPRGGPDEIVPSTRIGAPRVPDQIDMVTGIYRPKKAVIRKGAFSEQLKSLGPTKSFTLAQLKSKTPIALGATKVDMSRVLANPKSVANTAIALQKLNDTVRVNSTSFTVTQVNSGLMVRSFVNYSLLPGTCTIPARRTKVELAGVRCASKMTVAARDNAFATKGDPRYVADLTQRAAALALAKSRADEDNAMLAGDVAALRADFKDPAKRAALVSALGQIEVTRLEGLNDADLTAEIVNSGDTKLEELSYIPINDAVQTFTPAIKLGLTPPLPPGKVAADFDLGTNYFLAGFTLGREYEWRLRFEQRINRCLIGCAKTYYVEAFAGFNYGLGLRFPIEVTGTANYSKQANGSVTASITPKFRTFDGGPDKYLLAGLPKEKLFDGQEFVAQFGAYAGFGFDLPFYPSLDIAYSRELDFTDYLKGEFAGGNFAPPNPPKPGVPGEELRESLVISDVDLIGGQANFGIVGAQVFPAANIILTSNELSFKLADRIGKQTIPLKTSGEQVKVIPNSATGALEFDIKDPVYNLVLTVEPGINARLFVDIGVWGKTLDLPVFFPSLAISLPSGGASFACHDGTVCSRGYTLTPDSKELALQDLARWVNQHETYWLPECRDGACEKDVRVYRIATELAAKLKIKQGELQSPGNLYKDPYFANLFNDARTKAERSTGESYLRRFSIEFEPTWAGKCADGKCSTTIKSIRASTEGDYKKFIANGLPKPAPVNGISLGGPAWIDLKNGAENKATAAIITSIDTKIAGSKEKWIGKVKSEYDKQCSDQVCRLEVAVTADVMGGQAAKLYKLSPDLKVENVVIEVTKEFRPRFEKLIADSFKRTKVKIIG